MTQISTANLLYYLSGGAANSNVLLSLGGIISANQWSTATALDDAFPDVTGAQAASGITQYLCFYIKNVDPNVNGLLAGALYFLTQVMPADVNDKIAVGIGTAAKNGTEQTIANITTAPTGVTWVDASSCLTYATGVALPTPMVQNDYQSFWLRRTVLAGAVASGQVITACAYTAANPTVVTVGQNIPTGTVVIVSASTGTNINGTYQCTNQDATHITLPITVGSSGTLTITIPSGTYLAVGGDTTA